MNGRATTLPAVSLFPTPQEAADRLGELFPTAYLALHRRDGKRSELTGASRAVLQHLARSGPLTIGEAANHLARAQSVVSDIVTQLEGHGLLEPPPIAAALWCGSPTPDGGAWLRTSRCSTVGSWLRR